MKIKNWLISVSLVGLAMFFPGDLYTFKSLTSTFSFWGEFEDELEDEDDEEEE